jgi:hypothetical protein
VTLSVRLLNSFCLRFSGLESNDVFAGRYEIVKTLGQGLHGASFRAVDRKTKGVVLLKIFAIDEKPDLTQYSNHVAQLANALQGRDFDDFLLPYAQGDYEGSTYFVSPFVEGTETLANLFLLHGRCHRRLYSISRCG